MKNIFVIVFIGYLFCQVQMDTTKKRLTFDPGKSLNIPGILPKKLPGALEHLLLENEIESIKQKARDYEPEPVQMDDIVIMETNRGMMKLKLFPNIAPNHCYNFKKLANSGYYDGTAFHRIIPGFMIQGGDINSRDSDPANDGHGGPGWTVDAEFNAIKHKRGVLSMARSSDQNSAGSQFFICVADAPHLDGNYTAFGEVIENVHVTDHIVNTPTNYIQAKRMSSNTIPYGEDPDNWIVIQDSKTGQKLFSKVPKYKNKAEYEYEMRKKIKSDKPALSINIIKLRVINNFKELEK